MQRRLKETAIGTNHCLRICGGRCKVLALSQMLLQSLRDFGLRHDLQYTARNLPRQCRWSGTHYLREPSAFKSLETDPLMNLNAIALVLKL